MVSRSVAAGLVLIFVVLAVLWLFNTVLDNPIKTAGVVNNPDETAGLTGAENTIEITADGFSPKELTISVGETVTWVNKDAEEHWPASAMHPTHTVYPGSDIQKCGTVEEENIFDSCRGLLPGESWNFTFNEAGSWGYHNHLVGGMFGKIIVE